MKYVICIVGPTAVGKSALSMELAKSLETEIISSDSRQMYRKMNIGTAKPSNQELEEVVHHFIDILEPNQPYNAATFQQEAYQIIHKLHETKDYAIVVGGSTLYIDALWYGFDEMPAIKSGIRESLNEIFQNEGLLPLLKELETYDPVTFDTIDKHNHARVIRALEVLRSTGNPISHYRKGKSALDTPWSWIKVALTDERNLLYKRIDQRVLEMVEAGLEEEVKQLLHQYGSNAPGLQSIGYTEMIEYLQGTHDLAEAIRLIQRNSRRYAKRQLTWLRRYQDLHWVEAGKRDEVLSWIKEKVL